MALAFTFCALEAFAQANIYEVEKGAVTFNSEAPKELISATSAELRGLLDAGKRSFVFKIPIASFMGFNSPLQQEHFRENYMETYLFPEAVYKGKIVEEVDLRKDGTYIVRTKGVLVVHGIASERMIKVRITVAKDKIGISSDFTVLLGDHSIKIPRVVFEKLASEIKVSMTATLRPKN